MAEKKAITRAVKRLRAKAKRADPFAGYSKEEQPLSGYAALVGVFPVALAGALTGAKEDERRLPALSWSELLLLGTATHKLGSVGFSQPTLRPRERVIPHE